jgi:rhodanese-related sulfurtransferase
MRSLKKPASHMVKEAKNRIREYTAAEIIAWCSDADLLIVDIRDVREREREGFIPGSFHAPRGMIEFWVDPDSPYFKPVFGEARQFLFYCASGWRSALTVATLQDMGFEAAHMSDGFKGWETSGGLIERSS